MTVDQQTIAITIEEVSFEGEALTTDFWKASITGDKDIATAQYCSSYPTFPHELNAQN